MNPVTHLLIVSCAIAAIFLASPSGGTEVPKVESIELAPVQPYVNNKDVIWHDNFDKHDPTNWKYGEPKASGNTITKREALGGQGGSLELHYAKGKRGTGNRKIFFGDSPTGKPVRSGEQFTDVYWRIYVKHQKGWTGGGPAKMSRSMIMVSNKWNQAMISHVWSSGEALTLDPVRAVQGDRVMTKKYNDWGGLKWLGNKPVSKFKIHAKEESGRWVCVEARAKLNTPGKSDGYNALWIDGILQCERKNMNFRGSYTKKGINAVFLEAYWNKGSPVDQYRWYDDFVVSTKPIGPLTAKANPTLIKTPMANCAGWEAEIASGAGGANVVWKSKTIAGDQKKVAATAGTGKFEGKAEGATTLAHGTTYFCRVRQKDTAGAWSDWSTWHQPFNVDKSEGVWPTTVQPSKAPAGPGAKAVDDARKNVKVQASQIRKTFRERIIQGVRDGRKPRITIDMSGMPARGKIKSADENKLVLAVRGAEIPFEWEMISKRHFASIAEKFADDTSPVQLHLAAMFADAGRLERAAEHLRAAGSLTGKSDLLAKDVTLLIRTP